MTHLNTELLGFIGKIVGNYLGSVVVKGVDESKRSMSNGKKSGNNGMI